VFAATVVAGCVAFSCQVGRCETLAAAARYSELLVQPPPGADVKTQESANQLDALVSYVQSEAWGRWVRGLRGLPPAPGEASLVSILVVHREIMHATRDVGHPRGVFHSYRVQAAFLDAVGRELFVAWVTGRVGQGALYQLEAHRRLMTRHFDKLTRF
jgi:hypothetical protein